MGCHLFYIAVFPRSEVVYLSIKTSSGVATLGPSGARLRPLSYRPFHTRLDRVLSAIPPTRVRTDLSSLNITFVVA